MWWRVNALIALVGVSACSAGACDPSQAGFLSGIGCEASGAYNQRNQAQQATLSQNRAAALAAQADADDAQSRAAVSQIALDQQRQRLRAVDAQNAVLTRRLAALRADNQVDQVRLASAQARLNDLRQRRAALPSAPNDAGVRDIERQQQELLDITKRLGS